MMWWEEWLNRHIDAILVGVLLLTALIFTAGCASSTITVKMDYVFCKAGLGGDWRVATQIDRATGEQTPLLLLFPVGGPYNPDHVICAISGDHAILDLGVGKQS